MRYRFIANVGWLTQSAIAGLKAIYRPDFQYAKAGVMLLDLQDASVEQCELDLDGGGPDRSELMAVMDRINMRYGRGTLKLASAGIATKAGNAQCLLTLTIRAPDNGGK